MINKQGWEKKKLGDICETTSGGTPNRSKREYFEGNIPWVKSGELDKGLIIDTEEKITEEALKNSSAKLFPKGTLLIALYGATIGKLAFLGIEACTNQAICGIFKNDKIDSEFLYYFLLYKKPSLINKGVGGGQPNISQAIIKNLILPIPSVSIQQQIVSELDTLISIINKKKQQLEELDKLAQATFYDMFGDPVSNEKGWKKCRIDSVCKFTQGIQIGVEQQFTEKDDNCNRFLRISDYTQDCEIRYVKENNSKYLVKDDDVVIVRYGASAGFVGINKTGVLANNLFKLNHDREVLNNLFLYNQLQLEHYKSFILKIAFGAAMPALSFTVFKDFELILPPLVLQNQFSLRIESIEKQKELINKSIDDVQQLFDYTMDKYFN